MNKKKLLILVPDGVGLRNFAFSNFKKSASDLNFEVIYWNNTNFDLKTIGLTEVKTPKPKHHFLTDILKRVKIENYINWYAENFQDKAYLDYKFKVSKPISFNDRIKTALFSFFKWYFDGKRKSQIQSVMNLLEERTSYFQNCIQQLQTLKPDFVLCTNQRPITAIAPIQAAKYLKIPTATFIFSWDNLPKATMVIEPNFYFVWSEFMKKELVKYNPQISEDKIFVTGTPQFEIYRDPVLRSNQQEFAAAHGLKPEMNYICFSGDDHTTSPFDEYYLRDLAQSVLEINRETKEKRFAILFRRCPVDKSRRYDPILKEFGELILGIDPAWKALGEQWNQVMPMPEDQSLLVNTVHHSKMVFNVGSSMVFDFFALDKPCCYFNYDPTEADDAFWTIKRLNNFIHFRSIPNKSAVLWANKKEDIKLRIVEYFDQPSSWDIQSTKMWFEKIINQPIADASKNICEKINSLT